LLSVSEEPAICVYVISSARSARTWS